MLSTQPSPSPSAFCWPNRRGGGGGVEQEKQRKESKKVLPLPVEFRGARADPHRWDSPTQCACMDDQEGQVIPEKPW